MVAAAMAEGIGGSGCGGSDSGNGIDRHQQERWGRQQWRKQRQQQWQTTINQNAAAIEAKMVVMVVVLAAAMDVVASVALAGADRSCGRHGHYPIY